MATEHIKLEHRGHSIVVPYDAVAMIMIAKQTAGYPIQPEMRLVDECIAYIMKSCSAPEESENSVVDYQALLNGYTVHLIYEEVTAGGGILECFPGKEPRKGADMLWDFLQAANYIELKGGMRGLGQHERRAFKGFMENWWAAYMEHLVDEDAEGAMSVGQDSPDIKQEETDTKPNPHQYPQAGPDEKGFPALVQRCLWNLAHGGGA